MVLQKIFGAGASGVKREFLALTAPADITR